MLSSSGVGLPSPSAVPHRRLRVLYLTWRDGDHPESGGAETYVERTAQVLAGRGHQVTVFSASFPGAPPRVERGGVQIIRKGGRFTCYPSGMRFLRANRNHFDVVIDIHNGVPFWAPLVTRIPVVSLIHHLHKDQWPIIFGPRVGQLGWMVESRVAPKVYRRNEYVTVSQATMNELVELGVDRNRINITYSGNDQPADLDRYSSVPRSSHPRLIVLGRLVPHKHVEKAIDIVVSLRSRFPGLHLDVVGHGYWEAELRRYAESAGVTSQVTFHGFVTEDEKRTLLSQSWVLVMPSQKEGWGLTIVEAGLHGSPGVAFAYAGGVTESLIHGETGFLATSDEEMTAQVARLLEDSDLRERLGAQARAHAASFTWERTAQELEEVLINVVDGSRTRSPG